MKKSEILGYLDDLLRPGDFQDSSNNGLQVEAPDEINTVALAVDACRSAFEQAVAEGAELLFVHHGLFWGKPMMVTGEHYSRIKVLIEGSVGLYASHLPLDAHSEIGNNRELARMLGLEDVEGFGTYAGQIIGFGGVCPEPLTPQELADRLAVATGEPVTRIQAHGSDAVLRVACISGGAPEMMTQAAEAGYDAFVTGEPSHSWHHTAEELGLNVIYGGHWATETVGVKALGRRLEEELGLKTFFIDLPTGL